MSKDKKIDGLSDFLGDINSVDANYKSRVEIKRKNSYNIDDYLAKNLQRLEKTALLFSEKHDTLKEHSQIRKLIELQDNQITTLKKRLSLRAIRKESPINTNLAHFFNRFFGSNNIKREE